MTVFGDLENLAQSLEWEEQADNSGSLLSGYRSWNGALFYELLPRRYRHTEFFCTSGIGKGGNTAEGKGFSASRSSIDFGRRNDDLAPLLPLRLLDF